MITSSRNYAQRGAVCKRCRIIRMFIIATLFIVILGLIGGDKLRFLNSITPERVAALIWFLGGLLFAIKFFLWSSNKSKNNSNDPGQV